MFYLAAVFYQFVAPSFAPELAHYVGSGWDVVATMLFVNGLSVSGINSVVPGGWSISSEAFFYLLFPAVLTYVTNLMRALMLLLAATALSALNVVVRGMTEITHADGAALEDFFHFNFLSNAMSFACGVALYWVLKSARVWRVPPSAREILASLTLLALFAVAECNKQIPGSKYITIIVLSAVVYVVAAYQPRLLCNRPLAFLGRISFSLYLVHFFIVSWLCV
jgi:peptidoglycan/LPS O-acetylase OafA/YrhL